MEYLLYFLWLVTFCSVPANFIMRSFVIALLHKLGKYEHFDAPSEWTISDGLPLRTLHLANLSRREQLLVRAYFWTWVAAIFGSAALAIVAIFLGGE